VDGEAEAMVEDVIELGFCGLVVVKETKRRGFHGRKTERGKSLLYPQRRLSKA
jgi:hypothetical protein